MTDRVRFEDLGLSERPVVPHPGPDGSWPGIPLGSTLSIPIPLAGGITIPTPLDTGPTVPIPDLFF
jgi:hypothetical protein